MVTAGESRQNTVTPKMPQPSIEVYPGGVITATQFSNVDILGEHEFSEPGSCREAFVSDVDLKGLLQIAVIPCEQSRPASEDAGVSASDEFRFRSKKEALSIPFNRLLSYQELHPPTHSTPTFNSLLALAIRHTAYPQAFRILHQMDAEQIRPDDRTRALYVRLLARIGRREAALNFVRRNLAHRTPMDILGIWIEILGKHDPDLASPHLALIGGKRRRRDSAPPFAWNVYRILLSCISGHPQADDHRMDRVVIAAVRSLLHSSEIGAARILTMYWISRLQGYIGRPRRQRLLDLLHLHLATSDMGTNAFFKGRTLATTFMGKHPCLRPNSSTLFLLLRPLTRAQTNTTTHALQLVRNYRQKWGSRVIDSRVRRRIASIATREGRLSVARRWTEEEDRVSSSRDRCALIGQVMGGDRRSTHPHASSRKDAISEKMRWRWLKRRVRVRVRRKAGSPIMYYKEGQPR